MKVQWARVIKTTASLMMQYESKKIETLRGEYEQVVHSEDPEKAARAEILATKMRLADAKYMKIGHLKSLLLPCAEKASSFESLLEGISSVVTSNDAISDDFLCEHWKLEKRSQLGRFWPDSPVNVSKLPPMDRIQVMVKASIDNACELLDKYLNHPLSVEGQNIRRFTEEVIEHVSDCDLKRIPPFLEEQKKLLAARIHEFGQAPRIAESVSDMSQPSQEGLAALTAALVDQKPPVSTEDVYYSMEQYFYHMIGDRIFARLEDRDADEELAKRCQSLSQLAPDQILDQALCGGQIFDGVVELLRQVHVHATPTAKLVTCYKAVEELVSTIHKHTGKRPGIEDTMNPLQYCCILADIPQAASQMRFIGTMNRCRMDNTVFWHRFSMVRLALENIVGLELNDALQQEISSNKDVSEFVSISRKSFLTRRFPTSKQATDVENCPQVTLIADVFRDKPAGIESISEPIVIKGFKTYVVPNWKSRPGAVFSVLLVRTDCEDDTAVVRSVEFANNEDGLRTAAALIHPPGVELMPVKTPSGIVNATTKANVPPGMRLIPVVSGDVEREEPDLNMKIRFMMVNSLEGYRGLAEHHRVTEDLYGESSDDSAELLDRISMRTCQSLESLGLLTAKHPKRRIDWRVLAALKAFVRRYPGEDSFCDHLTRDLLWQLEDYARSWQNALQVTSFGYLVDAPRESWRLTAGLIQAYSSKSLTFKLDEQTVEVSQKIIRFVLQQPVGESTRAVLSKVLSNYSSLQRNQ